MNVDKDKRIPLGKFILRYERKVTWTKFSFRELNFDILYVSMWGAQKLKHRDRIYQWKHHHFEKKELDTE